MFNKLDHTEIKTIKLEEQGQKAFYEDDSDADKEMAADMCYPQRFNNKYPELAEKVMQVQLSVLDDTQYMGGQKETRGKSSKGSSGRQKKQGFVDRLMTMGGKNVGPNGNGDPKDIWDRMTEDEKEKRVD